MGSTPTLPGFKELVLLCLGSSMVERATVNREVVGSSPIRDGRLGGFFVINLGGE